MSGIVYERFAQEAEIARQWWELPPQTLLPLADGQRCLLIYNGERGGSAGPDVCDAVLYFLPSSSGSLDYAANQAEATATSVWQQGFPCALPHSRSLETIFPANESTSEADSQSSIFANESTSGANSQFSISANESTSEASSQFSILANESTSQANPQFSVPPNVADLALVGDVEFHIRASDWFAHNHHTDPRYNQVLLHVVLYLDTDKPTQRQDGVQIPTCSLLDLPQKPLHVSPWPCQQTPLAPSASTTTLLYAGLLRFHEKSQTLSQAIAETSPPPGSAYNAYDTCLLAALAEALGYGRDRAFFRAVGQRLVGLPTHIPEPLGHKPNPAPLDARRLHILSTLSARWQRSGAWSTFLPAFQPELDTKSALTALRTAFDPLSKARTDILICNVILPFAVAIANLENNTRLATRAQHLYLAYPALVSNRITRIMSTQLQLPAEPEQACLQQGLHYVYAQTCRAKECWVCLFGGKRL